jgi:hypothetical protein
MNNLALVLSDHGKYEQAEEIHQQALGLRETVLGKEHPSTLMSVYIILWKRNSLNSLSESKGPFI